jgi:hypothetical protein
MFRPQPRIMGPSFSVALRLFDGLGYLHLQYMQRSNVGDVGPHESLCVAEMTSGPRNHPNPSSAMLSTPEISKNPKGHPYGVIGPSYSFTCLLEL